MKKAINEKLWGSFIEVLNDPCTFNSYETYYTSIISWVKNNSYYFTEDLLRGSRLGTLLSLNPTHYIVDAPGFILEMEADRYKKNKPNNLDTLIMIISDRLWDMVTIRSGKDCPNCSGDEMRYLLAENPVTKEQKVILECESCAWTENTDGTRWDEGRANVIPANKHDLKMFGVE